MLPLIHPDLRFAEVEKDVRAILDSGLLTNGPYLARFEAAVAESVGVAHGVAVTSATTALHLALAALGVGHGDEVLLSDFTFPATGNVVVQLGAVPVLVDCIPGSFSIDVEHARTRVTSRTRAILPVDPFGQPANLDGVARLAQDEGLAVVEDAACALGASTRGVPCGGWPRAGCFSFHPRKVVTTGEGGMITTDDEDLAAAMRLLRSHGGEPANVGLRFVKNGFNYRLSEIPCALGISQLNRLDAILADRAVTAGRYRSMLAEVGGITVPWPNSGEVWTFQSFVVLLSDDIDRDGVVAAMRSKGIETTLGTYALHAHPAFSRYGYGAGSLPESWKNQQRTLTLPLVPKMSADDVTRVVSVLSAAIYRGQS